MTREEARASADRAGFCGAQSKPLIRRDPLSFQICTNDRGHEPPEHTSCDGHGHVLARWRTETSLVEVWLPDGSWHLR